jgi:predicted TIM-barrel fold metal-dependent hydrolase
MTINADATSGGWDTHIHVFDGGGLQGSHYVPPVSTIEMWQHAAAKVGVTHAVLVQPSVYGTDNGVLLAALRATNGTHRGVVVIDPDTSEHELAEMQRLGVRGVRVNLVSPVGNAGVDIDRLAERIAPFGWHMQFYAAPSHWERIVEIQQRWRLDVVLDHFAGMRPGVALSTAEAHNLHTLANNGAWIKCSAIYRLGVTSPFSAGTAIANDVLASFRGRVVWGSDWPHTWYLEPQEPSRASQREAAPTFAELLLAFADAFGDPVMQHEVMVAAPQRLYQ